MMGKKRMGYCMGVPIDVEVVGYVAPQVTEDWQRCCLAYQGDTVPCETACLHCHRMGEVVKTEVDRIKVQRDHALIEMERARRELENLVEACAYVSPIAGAVATNPSVKDIRAAAKFVKAVESARALLGNQ